MFRFCLLIVFFLSTQAYAQSGAVLSVNCTDPQLAQANIFVCDEALHLPPEVEATNFVPFLLPGIVGVAVLGAAAAGGGGGSTASTPSTTN